LNNIYFASDFHLGVQGVASSFDREKLICDWLIDCSHDASSIYLLGDLFDFWFEYKYAVPKGFTRLLGTMATLKDRGIEIKIWTGNHDLWMRDYFKVELGIQVYYKPIIEEINGKMFFIGHGDGLGPGDYGYKRMKKIFMNPVSKFLYRWLHPDLGIPLANFFSSKSRETQVLQKDYLGHQKEWLIQYVEQKSKEIKIDYYIFGHRHLPIDYKLNNNVSRYINLGDWLIHQSYAKFDGTELNLLFYKNENGKIYH